MVTPADLEAFQQQLRQEMTDVIQQVRAEVNETNSGRMDMLSSIMHVRTCPKPCRISDVFPRNWESS